MIRFLLGFILLGIDIVWLFLFISGPDSKLEADMMTALTCHQGERFTSSPPATSIPWWAAAPRTSRRTC